MPTPWEANLDPSDNVDFYADFGEPTAEGTAPVLTAGEIIASFTVIPTTAATAAGLLIGDTGQYAPAKANGDRAVKMLLSIDPDQRDNCALRTSAGLALGVEVSDEQVSGSHLLCTRTWTLPPRSIKRQ